MDETCLENVEASKQCWFALRVLPRREKTAALALKNKGYQEFLPLYCSRRRWSDRVVDLERPLFPGYLFCRFDPQDRRVPILTTPGVVEFVGIRGIPLPVAEHEIAAVQTLVNSGRLVQPWPFVNVGDRVRVEVGSLAGLEGILVDQKKHHRLVVSISLLQRSVAVEIDRDWVKWCPRPPARSAPVERRSVA